MDSLLFFADLADEINANPNHSPEATGLGIVDYVLIGVCLVSLMWCCVYLFRLRLKRK
jgi:hypothetical protein